jgi:hypothetical protein
MYAVGCVIYKLIMNKTPFDCSNYASFIGKVIQGDFEKILKKKEGGIYSDEIVDLTHLLMDLVSICYLLLFIINYYYKQCFSIIFYYY